MKKIILSLLAAVIFLAAFYFFWLLPNYTVPILTYHSINYGEGSHFVTPGNFTKQMEYIKKNGYEVITLGELVKGIQNRKKFKRNQVVITIDDGYEDNFVYAYPILKKFGFPATIFIITNFIGKEKNFLSWDQLRIMSKDKISFGGHTKSHFYFGREKNDEVAREEVAGCKNIIERETHAPVDYFCYPGGGFDERVKRIVKEAGYKGACATNRGFIRRNCDVYELKRIKIKNSDANYQFSFWVKLSGYYNLFRSLKDSN